MPCSHEKLLTNYLCLLMNIKYTFIFINNCLKKILILFTF